MARQKPEDASPESEFLDGSPRKRGRLFYGCATIVALLVLIITYIGGVFWYAREAMAPSVDEFLLQLEQRNFQTMYAAAAPSWRARQSFEEFTDTHRGIRFLTGPLIQKTLLRVSFKKENGETFGSMLYQTWFARAEGTVRFKLQRSGGKWLVADADFTIHRIEQYWPGIGRGWPQWETTGTATQTTAPRSLSDEPTTRPHYRMAI